MSKGTVIGRCKLCLETKELNFEHTPPRSAFNKETKYYILDQTEYYQKAKAYTFENLKPKSRKEQGGIGQYSFCFDCNGFLGSKYVRDYKKFAQIAMGIIQSNDKNAKAFEFDISAINLLKFLKQIIAIFIASNNHSFTESYPELLEFVKNEKLTELPEKFRFYMYLNNEGQNRNGHIHFTNLHGVVCEFTFRPFGFVLNIDNPKRILQLSEITDFKHYEKIKMMNELPLTLNKYPTHYPIPLDYRSEKEINDSM
ncbi:hypothetical protein R9C00_22275 [Flammeovirgaceae bacterium SG7u.111]|nr:hypothetical protein [Flammeovirgaceae bacterium SG7u.132]WPO34430.1 hypothetical protein R9C00_22275 [Flammeovirgaceae bacterium SG7u.111]